MAKKRSILAGLDIGTHKTAIVIAEESPAGLEILGVGTAVSRGMRAGRLSDVERTTEAIGVALAEAELMAGCQINQVTVSVSGDHVRGQNSHGVVPIDNGEVSPRVARRAVETAQALPLPADHSILHLICREYVVDGQGGISEPVGMNGIRMEAHLHVVSACESVVGNLRKCCNRAGLSVAGVVSSSLASAEAVLEPEEKELGVAVVDFGAGTVDLAIYSGSAVVYSSVLTIAGAIVTSDLSRCLETTMADAERIKKQDGVACPEALEHNSSVEVLGVGGRVPRMVTRRLVADIIASRMEEIFESVQDEIIRSGYGELLTSGVVLTGGSAMMPGVVDVASAVLGRPVRLGEPRAVVGLSDEVDDPTWSTAVGLARGLKTEDLSRGWTAGFGDRIVPQWLRKRMSELF